MSLALVGLETLAQSPEVWAHELLADADGLGGYGLIVLLAAVPLLEILVVIPIGVGLGFQPVAVAVAAFGGNLLPIYGLIVAHKRLEAYLENRKDDAEPSKRRQRAKQLWERYGLAGLAIASPVTTGVHLAAVFALGLGSSRRATALWMTASIAAWTVLITLGSVFALSTIQTLV